MPFTIELPYDLADRVGQKEIIVEAQNCEQALSQIVATFPSCKNLLINSSNEFRSTICFSMDDIILNRGAPVPANSKVKLFFQRAGG